MTSLARFFRRHVDLGCPFTLSEVRGEVRTASDRAPGEKRQWRHALNASSADADARVDLTVSAVTPARMRMTCYMPAARKRAARNSCRGAEFE